MGKRVFMFPGQGSQYIGMGKEFYDTMPNAKAVIDLASEQTGLDIPALCFEENDKLNITEYTQICMLAVEAAIYQAIIDKGITPDVTAGLSLGEYGALIASGAMTMADAFAVVRKRGIYMQEAVPTGCYHRRKGSSRCRRSSMQRGRRQEMRTAQGQRTFPFSNA